MMTINFPSKEDALFKADGSGPVAWLGNPLGRKEDRYSSGFCLAGEILMKHVLKDDFDKNCLIYPIILNYRHGIELHLKNILRDGQELLAHAENVPGNHGLLQLWNMCKPIVVKIWPHGDKGPLLAMDRLIKELSDVDPDGVAFRYAKDQKGNPTLGTLEAVDLETFGEVIEKITHFLNCVSTGILEYLSSISEMAAEGGNDGGGEHWN